LIISYQKVLYMPLGITYLRLEREASAFISWSVEGDIRPQAAAD